MEMRKSVISMGLALILVMAFTSCKKTEEGKSENAVFRASTVSVTSSDKTYVGQQGPNKFVMWNAGDAIKVFTRTASPFSVEASVLTTDENAKSVVPFYGNVRESDVYYAFYPACNISDMDAAGKIHVTLPETQAYTEGGFAVNTFPMWADSTEKYFNFRSTCAILGIQLKGNAKVGSIVLSSKSADEPLAGTVEIDAAAFNPSSPSYTFPETKKSVTLNCGEQGVQLDENKDSIFYFVIPANTYHGIEVVVNDLQGNKLGEKETFKDLQMGADTIYKMNPFTVNADTPEPGVEGYFTVNSNGDQVVFAPGNLYYLPNAEHKWQFAPRHYSRMSVEEQLLTEDPNINRDLFGWATSGYHDPSDVLNTRYQPYDVYSDMNYNNIYNVYGYGPSATPSGGTDIGGNGVVVKPEYDWGQYNLIYNPSTDSDYPKRTWRLLTKDEWNYVMSLRQDTRTNLGVANARFAKATLLGVGDDGSDVTGLIVFPDGYAHPTGVQPINGINVGTANFTVNKIRSDYWDKMDLAGAVFLPSGGRKNGDFEHKDPESRPNWVAYWSATHNHESENASACFFYCDHESFDPNTTGRRCNGLHVRLVKDVPKPKCK